MPDQYLYIPPSECHCKGLNTTCPDCEFRELWQKAEKIEIGKKYKISDKNKDTINQMHQLFKEPCTVHPIDWIIDIVNDRVIRKVVNGV